MYMSIQYFEYEQFTKHYDENVFFFFSDTKKLMFLKAETICTY